MQMRLNDITINNNPKFLSEQPSEENHAIIADDLLIPLELDGITAYFPASKPTQYEYDTCLRIELTSPVNEWNPNDPQYAQDESSYLNDDGFSKRDGI